MTDYRLTLRARLAILSSCVKSSTRCRPSRYDTQYTMTLSIRVVRALSLSLSERESEATFSRGDLGVGAGGASSSLSSGDKTQGMNAYRCEVLTEQQKHVMEYWSFMAATYGTRCLPHEYSTTQKVKSTVTTVHSRLLALQTPVSVQVYIRVLFLF